MKNKVECGVADFGRELSMVAKESDKIISFLKREPNWNKQKEKIEDTFNPDRNKVAEKIGLEAKFFLLKAKRVTNWANKEQASYIAKRIPYYIKRTKARLDCYAWQESSYNHITIYNEMIPSLLGKVSREDGEKLFESFEIEESFDWTEPFSDLINSPVKKILQNCKIDNYWKSRVVDRVHQKIEAQEDNFNGERMVNQYGLVLGDLSDNNFNNSEYFCTYDFCRDEMLFILRKTKNRGPVVKQDKISNFLYILSPYKKEAHEFARRQVMENRRVGFGGFKILNKEDVGCAKEIMSCFPEDKEMSSFLKKRLPFFKRFDLKKYFE